MAELKADVECLRALTYQACEHYIAGEDVTEWATMAKLKAGRLNRIVPDTCLQFWGGMGFTWENKVSRMYRDGRLASIGGGADEVMLSASVGVVDGLLPGDALPDWLRHASVALEILIDLFVRVKEPEAPTDVADDLA